MALEVLTEPAASQQQLDLYNRSSTSLIKRATYSPSAGLNWAIIGCVLADVATQEDVPTLVSNIQALGEVDNVVSPQFWGQIPSELLINPSGEDATHECKLHVSSNLSCTVGYGGDTRGLSQKQNETITPPLNKKWLVLNVVTPSGMNENRISNLESAVQGVTGITTCEHLIDGTVPSNASQCSLQISTRMRIDPVEA